MNPSEICVEQKLLNSSCLNSAQHSLYVESYTVMSMMDAPCIRYAIIGIWPFYGYNRDLES